MTYQKQSPMDIKTQLTNIDESVRILRSIIDASTNINKQTLLQEIVDAKLKLKRKKQNSERPIKYGFLIALPLILCILIMDTLMYGPQYLISIKGMITNLPILFLSTWISSGFFKNFNSAGQSILESKIDDLEQRLYGQVDRACRA